MCRLLLIREPKPFPIADHLNQFAAMSQASSEYQGHGWGIAFRSRGRWRIHKALDPIWQCDLDQFGTCDFLLVHARSAFQNEGIVLENNMPFSDDRYHFIFNGELRGVRLKVPGQIGAAKIFNFIRRLDRGDMEEAFRRATNIIEKQTRYLRAMNILMTDGEKIYLDTRFNEDDDYFTMYRRQGSGVAFCSQPLEGNWHPIPNRTTLVA